MAEEKAFTSEAEETRDTDELIEKAIRMAFDRLGAGGWPCSPDGIPMTIVTGAASDKIPTVQFGNVVVGPVMIQRPVVATSLQDVIDAARETQKAAEFVVGVERRLLQWALDPAAKVRSPVDAQEAFSAPPAGYVPAQTPVDPRVPVEASEAAAKLAAAAPPPPSAPAS